MARTLKDAPEKMTHERCIEIIDALVDRAYSSNCFIEDAITELLDIGFTEEELTGIFGFNEGEVGYVKLEMEENDG